MTRVTGIGGVFFKARDAEALRAWYAKHLGIDVQPWGWAAFRWNEPEGVTAWTVLPASSDYFSQPFMINYRVADLAALLEALRSEGCDVAEGSGEESEFGKFGWVTDPEGNRIELWEPPSARLPG